MIVRSLDTGLECCPADLEGFPNKMDLKMRYLASHPSTVDLGPRSQPLVSHPSSAELRPRSQPFAHSIAKLTHVKTLSPNSNPRLHLAPRGKISELGIGHLSSPLSATSLISIYSKCSGVADEYPCLSHAGRCSQRVRLRFLHSGLIGDGVPNEAFGFFCKIWLSNVVSEVVLCCINIQNSSSRVMQFNCSRDFV
ncbi:tetratricopeptide repeat protein [Striga asiatica]|uniref:Tetratricopeptide repeat protein n=1 Tax=Striga asiatica TaxID=4170 RepID=A0A5A7PUU0_STRAF|nr:tetratricopeptide repeat protein [Striga asiatica]